MHVDTNKLLAKGLYGLEIAPEHLMALIFSRQMQFHHYLVDIVKIVHGESS